jgi:hypothetical protein
MLGKYPATAFCPRRVASPPATVELSQAQTGPPNTNPGDNGAETVAVRTDDRVSLTDLRTSDTCSDLISAIDKLVEFVKNNSPETIYEPARRQELGQLDVKVFALCQRANLRIPDILPSTNPDIKHFGNTRIPCLSVHSPMDERGKIARSGICLHPDANWLQAMMGLRELAALSKADVLKRDAPPPSPLDPLSTYSEDDWITLADAATLSGVSEGTISRAASNGEIRDNEKKHKGRRFHAGSFIRWFKGRQQQNERMESDESVKKKVDRHCKP